MDGLVEKGRMYPPPCAWPTIAFIFGIRNRDSRYYRFLESTNVLSM